MTKNNNYMKRRDNFHYDHCDSEGNVIIKVIIAFNKQLSVEELKLLQNSSLVVVRKEEFE